MIIGVVGLGTMGLGIAQVFAAAGHQVRATDAMDPARASAPARMRAALEPRVAKGALTAGAMAKTLANLHIGDLASLAPCDMVIEAILETLPAKQALFAAVEAILGPTAILATNTSSLSVSQIARTMRHPERLLGLHFFNPAPAMKLVELIPHATTAPTALTLARQITESAGKTVIASPDRPGFIVNRCARPFYGEALALLEEGRTQSAFDAAMLAAGYRIGPLSLIDLIGADINLAAT
ncbi:MAG: 3-hydroxybutyryl-CoA dehydrogenase, partial [Pseudorhodobacter sp.]|nr:3-hydroxybutyryl-CoA dehydrogenase [Pseudorhodobacter sp.]